MKRLDLHSIHGAFSSKKDAEEKEAATPGAFIQRTTYRKGPLKGQTRYLVLRPGRGKRAKIERDRRAVELRRKRGRRVRLEDIPF